MRKVLTSPSSMGQVGFEPFDLLKKNGFEVINNPYGRRLNEDEVVELAKDCIGIVAGVEPLTAQVMDALPKLKCISRVGVGMDNVNLEYAKKKDIIVVNTPEGPTRSVAEMTLAMTMALLRRIPQADADMKNGHWEKQIGNLIQNKLIGVIGVGRIGKLVSELFMGIGNTVIGFDIYPDNKWAERNNVEMKAMEEVLAEADILTIHVSGNPDKSPLITENEIRMIKDGAFLINMSRGGVVDERALYQALTNNNLAGAAIDVFLEEPYFGVLSKLKNVVLTPHLGSYAKEGKLQMEINAVKNLIQVIKSK